MIFYGIYKNYISCCSKNDHDALMSVFLFLSTPLSIATGLKFQGHSTSLKAQYSLSALIRPFCIMFSMVIYDVFMHNNALWSNSNAFSLIICKVHTKRENTGRWNSGPKKATLGYQFCTTPNELKLHGEFLWNI